MAGGEKTEESQSEVEDPTAAMGVCAANIRTRTAGDMRCYRTSSLLVSDSRHTALSTWHGSAGCGLGRKDEVERSHWCFETS